MRGGGLEETAGHGFDKVPTLQLYNLGGRLLQAIKDPGQPSLLKRLKNGQPKGSICPQATWRQPVQKRGSSTGIVL